MALGALGRLCPGTDGMDDLRFSEAREAVSALHGAHETIRREPLHSWRHRAN